MKESSWIINRGLIGSFYRSKWCLVQIFISDLSSETFVPACELVIKAASDPYEVGHSDRYIIYIQYTLRSFFVKKRNNIIYLSDRIERNHFHFFPLTMKFMFIYPIDWKCKKDNEFVVLMYKQQFYFFSPFQFQFDEFLLT